MSNKNKTEKVKMEKYRQSVARHYNNELVMLRDKVRELENELRDTKKTLESQEKLISKQDEQIALYKMVVGLPESKVAEMISEAHTKHEFLNAVIELNKLYKNS